MNKAIAIVEDEQTLAALVSDYCKAAGYDSVVFHNGSEASTWFQSNSAALAVLDIMLPGQDGLSLCREIKQHSPKTGIIMATAKVEEVDRLLGLELGADDYLCKPYSPKELILRIKAILRRTQGDSTKQEVQLDKQRLCVNIHGTEVQLTAIECALFALLFQRRGHIFSRAYIMDNIYSDYRVVSDRTVDSHIKKLRKKLSEAAPELQLIHSIYGAGYKYEYQQNNN
ncbi:response regulator [Agaribacterium haliotis]|uniref:response regulator n=1 Tax=Agaribacterium haliotis TaxID=2013869 RepID=UPI000BB53650|nr:response regulator [Agaribacterium haliotis]